MELLQGEILQEIHYLDNLYGVTNYGRVWTYPKALTGALAYTKKNKKGKWLNPTDNGTGYKIVSLTVNKKRKNQYVHRLVATAFIENTKGKKEVNHIDGNKSNNNVSNLEWVTSKENKKHARENGLTKIARGSKFITNTSGYVGVSFHKSSSSFRVNIKYEKFSFEKRGFNTAKEASYYYDAYSLILHGSTGNTNHNWSNYDTTRN